MNRRHKATPGEFRLIRALSVEDNVKRLRKHIERLQQRMHFGWGSTRIPQRNRRLARARAQSQT